METTQKDTVYEMNGQLEVTGNTDLSYKAVALARAVKQYLSPEYRMSKMQARVNEEGHVDLYLGRLIAYNDGMNWMYNTAFAVDPAVKEHGECFHLPDGFYNRIVIDYADNRFFAKPLQTEPRMMFEAWAKSKIEGQAEELARIQTLLTNYRDINDKEREERIRDDNTNLLAFGDIIIKLDTGQTGPVLFQKLPVFWVTAESDDQSYGYREQYTLYLGDSAHAAFTMAEQKHAKLPSLRYVVRRVWVDELGVHSHEVGMRRGPVNQSEESTTAEEESLQGLASLFG